MDSQLSERLDYLMSITNTANNLLARELSFDPSYVGRIRNGKRGIPHRQPFIEPTARFLSSRIEKPWQARSVAERLGLVHRLPNDQEGETSPRADRPLRPSACSRKSRPRS